MELPNLGEHCSFNECNKLDFLPFKCISGCGKSFCGDHYKKVFIKIFIFNFCKSVKISNLKTLQEIHKCSTRDKIVRAITCPLCSKSVPIVDVTGEVRCLSSTRSCVCRWRSLSLTKQRTLRQKLQMKQSTNILIVDVVSKLTNLLKTGWSFLLMWYDSYWDYAK